MPNEVSSDGPEGAASGASMSPALWDVVVGWSMLNGWLQTTKKVPQGSAGAALSAGSCQGECYTYALTATFYPPAP